MATTTQEKYAFIKVPQGTNSFGQPIYSYYIGDTNTNTVIPITNQAIVDKIKEQIPNLDANSIEYSLVDFNNAMQSGTWKEDTYRSFNSDGTLVDDSIHANIQKDRYGQTANPQRVSVASQMLSGILGLIKTAPNQNTNPNLAIQPDTISKVLSDPNQLGFYLTAMSYGDYTTQDVLKDILKNQIIQTSPNSATAQTLKTQTIIDPTKTKSQYSTTPEYQAAANNSSLNLDLGNSNISKTMLDLPLINAAPEFFQMYDKAKLGQFQQDVKDKMDNMLYLEQQMHMSKDETQRAAAKAEYDKLVDDVNHIYGIKLSGNVQTAWDQMDQILQQSETGGIMNTGLYREAIDKSLEKARNTNEALRWQRDSQNEDTRKQYYQNSATYEEMQAYAQTPQGQADLQKWGLMASDSDKAWNSKIDQEIQRIQNDSTLSEAAKAMQIQRLQLQKIGNGTFKPSARQSTLDQNLFIDFQNKYNLASADVTQTDAEKEASAKRELDLNSLSGLTNNTDNNNQTSTDTTTSGTDVGAFAGETPLRNQPTGNTGTSFQTALNNVNTNTATTQNTSTAPLSNAKATLINSAGQKVVVSSNSPEAKNYFSQGYVLMGANGKPVTSFPTTSATSTTNTTSSTGSTVKPATTTSNTTSNPVSNISSSSYTAPKTTTTSSSTTPTPVSTPTPSAPKASPTLGDLQAKAASMGLTWGSDAYAKAYSALK